MVCLLEETKKEGWRMWVVKANGNYEIDYKTRKTESQIEKGEKGGNRRKSNDKLFVVVIGEWKGKGGYRTLLSFSSEASPPGAVKVNSTTTKFALGAPERLPLSDGSWTSRETWNAYSPLVVVRASRL